MNRYRFKWMTLLIAVVLGISGVGCQTTPENEIVTGKSLDNMIEKATEIKPDQELQFQKNMIAEKVSATESYIADLSDAKGKVSIHVNAAVSMPNATGVSVQRVGVGEITQADVDVLLDNLLKGDAFSGDDYIPAKSEIYQQILGIQSAENQGTPQNSGYDRFKEEITVMRAARLEQLQKQLEIASETSVRIPCSGELAPIDYDKEYANGEKLYALAQSDSGGYESISVYNYDNSTVSFVEYTSEKNGFSRNMGYFGSKESVMTDPYNTEKDIQEASINKEDAMSQAQELIDALGLESMRCFSAEKRYGGSYEMAANQLSYLNPRKSVWLLRYTRSVNGVPITYTAYDCIKVDDENQSAPWSYETMTFAIDDSGIVGFSWHSPYIASEIITEDANLISFDEVTSVFEKMSPVVNAWDGISAYNPSLTSAEITVDQVVFGLTRITEENRRDSGLLVPAWDFIGTMTYISNENGQVNEFESEPIPILTINAIDGSVINRSLGY